MGRPTRCLPNDPFITFSIPSQTTTTTTTSPEEDLSSYILIPTSGVLCPNSIVDNINLTCDIVIQEINITTTTTTTTTTTSTTTTSTTTTAIPIVGNNSANYGSQAVWGSQANITTVGSNGRSSYYGTYDQGGNVFELNSHTGSSGDFLGIRGGSWNENQNYMTRSIGFRALDSSSETYLGNGFGFRIASSGNPLFLNLVLVGDSGNASDSASVPQYGRVEYNYYIGKYPVTNCEYAQFLNAVDPQGLNPQNIYNPNMSGLYYGGINLISSNIDGNKYQIKTNMSNKPVTFVNWWDCARYCNWLHNGKQNYVSTSGAENIRNSGAYIVGTNTSGSVVAKQPNAQYYIPTENEWYKAAYYKGSGTNAGYWLYPTQSDSQPSFVVASISGDGSGRVSDYVCPTTTTTTTTTESPIFESNFYVFEKDFVPYTWI